VGKEVPPKPKNIDVESVSPYVAPASNVKKRSDWISKAPKQSIQESRAPKQSIQESRAPKQSIQESRAPKQSIQESRAPKQSIQEDWVPREARKRNTAHEKPVEAQARSRDTAQAKRTQDLADLDSILSEFDNAPLKKDTRYLHYSIVTSIRKQHIWSFLCMYNLFFINMLRTSSNLLTGQPQTGEN
jgi:hypothetical protein